jgi:N-succinyldiaminopimelate aminotransferase
MNPHLELLQPYPFERLRSLLADLRPADKPPIALSIGEPRHPSPKFVLDALEDNLARVASYPATAGAPALRESIAAWVGRRFAPAELDPERQVLPVNGTREALFAFAQAVVTGGEDALVVTPNPFYQIYEGAALLAGARPLFVNCTDDTGFLPDFGSVTEAQWRRCQLLYLCNPGNPTGAVMDLAGLVELVNLAQEHDFVIAGDECYSEIYFEEAVPPTGLLQACLEAGNTDFRNCVVFHSLSKRSNLPGLRSGFVAGDADILADFLLYRTYHGSAMPPHHQLASTVAWQDEQHVRDNRMLYRAKFASVMQLLMGHIDVTMPSAGFYLWPSTPISDTDFARELYTRENVSVLPGRYLARTAAGVNPGENRVRMALVAELDNCVEAARRIVDCVGRL